MTAPRKPVAWISPDRLERLEQGWSSVVYGDLAKQDGRVNGLSIPLYTETNLQPLWALVEKWEAQSQSARFTYPADATRIQLYASELRAALEVMNGQ